MRKFTILLAAIVMATSGLAVAGVPDGGTAKAENQATATSGCPHAAAMKTAKDCAPKANEGQSAEKAARTGKSTCDKSMKAATSKDCCSKKGAKADVKKADCAKSASAKCDRMAKSGQATCDKMAKKSGDSQKSAEPEPKKAE